MFKSNTTICYLPRDTFDLWYIVLVIQLNYSLLFVSFFFRFASFYVYILFCFCIYIRLCMLCG